VRRSRRLMTNGLEATPRLHFVEKGHLLVIGEARRRIPREV